MTFRASAVVLPLAIMVALTACAAGSDQNGVAGTGAGPNTVSGASLDDIVQRDLLPLADRPAPAPDYLDEIRRYAQCMRENGFPDYPDPDPVTGWWLGGWIRQGDKAAEAAMEKCASLAPRPAPTSPPR